LIVFFISIYITQHFAAYALHLRFFVGHYAF
jgi:hypothetical protein